MKAPVITLAKDFHHDTSVVRLRFEKDYGLISKVKTLIRAAWSQSRGFWYIANDCISEVFATHYLEQCNDLRYIQEWLGHESSKTTEIYTHTANTALAKIKRPFDGFFEANVSDTNMLQK
jgi:integrase